MIDYSRCIETVTGKLINPMEPAVEMICVEDIAWALSRIPRFAGHTITEIPYNVAQHSVYVSELVEKMLNGDLNEILSKEFLTKDLLDAIQSISNMSRVSETVKINLLIKSQFHDAHESYIGDIPSPIKKIPELRAIVKQIEHSLDTAIWTHLGLTPNIDQETLIIKFADKLAQAIEGYQFMPSRGLNWELPRPSLILLQKFSAPLTPLESYVAFLNRYECLRGRRCSITQ